MSDWAKEKAREIVSHEIGFYKPEVVFGRQHLRDKITQALREARAEGMREAAKLIDDMKASKFWVNAIRIRAAASGEESTK